MNYGKEFTKGILKENPTLVGLLGMCPTLAVTTAAFNGIGMGLSTMFVLICSNIVISLLRKVIPEQVKLPCYIVIIASFVTVIQFLVHGFVPALYTSLGAFLELITVNCIILGRAEMFACVDLNASVLVFKLSFAHLNHIFYRVCYRESDIDRSGDHTVFPFLRRKAFCTANSFQIFAIGNIVTYWQNT